MIPADFSKRLLAHNIDLLPLLCLFYLASLILPRSNWDAALLYLIYMAYHICFEAGPWKATPGKKWCHLAVKTKHNKTHSLVRIVSRNTLKILSLALFFGGFLLILFHPKKQALHDLIAGTAVINDTD